MKVRELNALIQKLNKTNPDADVQMGFSTLIGPQFDDPYLVEARDGIYIIPKALENNIEEKDGRDEVGKVVQEVHSKWVERNQGGEKRA